jgi:dinuclear metal center YbgI/SA1388 family protein
LIYNSLESITDDNRVGQLISKLIKNSISLFVVHTCFDSHPKGTNYLLAEKLGLKIKGVLSEYSGQDTQNTKEIIGMGVIAEFDKSIPAIELITKVKENINNNIRINDDIPNKIKRVAIVGGSGFSFVDKVLDRHCDAFITSDITYHKFHEINSKILLIDAGHYETEQFIIKGIFSLINGKLQDDVNILVSKINTNPISYI